MTTSLPETCFYRPTPGKLVAGLLVIELCFFIADRLSLFGLQLGSGWNVICAIGIFVGASLVGFIWFVLSLILKTRFQFGVLSLLGLMCVVAVVGGWFCWKLADAKRQEELAEKINNYATLGYRMPPRNSLAAWIESWSRELLGMHFLSDIRTVSGTFDNEGLKYVAELRHIEMLDIRPSDDEAWVTDEGLQHVMGLSSLKRFCLLREQTTPEGLKRLRQALPKCDIHVGW